MRQIFLKVATNIQDGNIVRGIQYEDVTDHGRYPLRHRTSSVRSGHDPGGQSSGANAGEAAIGNDVFSMHSDISDESVSFEDPSFRISKA